MCAVAFGPVRTKMLDELSGSNSYYKTLFASSSPDRMARLAFVSAGPPRGQSRLHNDVLAWWARAMPYEFLLPIVSLLMRPRVVVGTAKNPINGSG